MTFKSHARHGASVLLLCLVVVVALSSVTTGGATGRSEDQSPATLEDIYGDTGNTFQAAIGFVVFEGDWPGAQPSYGLAVDDMVVKWKEWVLDPDVTDCAVSLNCAVVDLATTNVFQSQAVLTITLLENTPDPTNDCDLDGTPDATVDCNGNGIPDLVVSASSEADLTGETIFLDTVGGDVYKGSVTVSALGDSPGVLFIARQGVDSPTVTVTYLDNDIDPGPGVEICPNDVDPAKWGLVQAFTTVFLGETCEVAVVETPFVDNGDGDLFVDTEETVDMQI